MLSHTLHILNFWVLLMVLKSTSKLLGILVMTGVCDIFLTSLVTWKLAFRRLETCSLSISMIFCSPIPSEMVGVTKHDQKALGNFPSAFWLEFNLFFLQLLQIFHLFVSIHKLIMSLIGLHILHLLQYHRLSLLLH